jgi:hypothetical protein
LRPNASPAFGVNRPWIPVLMLFAIVAPAIGKPF